MEARYLPAGDHAVTVEFDRDITPEANSYVRGMDLALQNSPIQGITEILPTIRSLLIYYDPEKLNYYELRGHLEEREREMTRITFPPRKLIEIPCCYGGEYGPDLDYVASVNGLDPSEVVRIHTNTQYQVYCFGTAPGSPNMGINSAQIATPRRPSPRTSITPGTVAIGGKQCVIYIVEIPGGHWLLGKTPLKLYKPSQPLERRFGLGDLIQFYSINEQEFRETMDKQSESNKEEGTAPFNSGNSEKKSTPVLEVISPGVFTTIQDLGRYGYQKYGIAVTGAMDDVSLKVANLLVGNSEMEAALEITLVGPEIRVLNDTVVAIMGGDLDFEVNNQSVGIGKAILVRKGDILGFGSPRSGCRAYLALAGGINVPKILGSRSTFLRGKIGGMEGRPLRAGDILFTGKTYPQVCRAIEIGKLDRILGYEKNSPVRLVLGPQDDFFTKEAIDLFLSSTYTISHQSDRAGYRLEGPQIFPKGESDIISDGVPPGGIQILPNGNPVVFFRDRQIGGYPKIGVVITADLSRIAQMEPGDRIRFEAVSLDEAHALYKEFKDITNPESIIRLYMQPIFF
jgi:KipI family sensor histidine kinase inhibitor